MTQKVVHSEWSSFLQRCARPLNQWRQCVIDWSTLGCTNSPRSSFPGRQKYGLVSRSPPFASCGDMPWRPGPTAARCLPSLPQSEHARQKDCGSRSKHSGNQDDDGDQQFSPCWSSAAVTWALSVDYRPSILPVENHSMKKPQQHRYICDFDFEVPALIRYTAFRFTKRGSSHGIVRITQTLRSDSTGRKLKIKKQKEKKKMKS